MKSRFELNSITFAIKDKIFQYTVVISWYILTAFGVFMTLEESLSSNQAGILLSVREWYLQSADGKI